MTAVELPGVLALLAEKLIHETKRCGGTPARSQLRFGTKALPILGREVAANIFGIRALHGVPFSCSEEPCPDEMWIELQLDCDTDWPVKTLITPEAMRDSFTIAA